MQRMTGLLVGAVFGAVFVVVNAQSPLNTVTVNLLRVAACLAAASVMALWFVTARKERSVAAPQRNMFSRGYLLRRLSRPTPNQIEQLKAQLSRRA